MSLTPLEKALCCLPPEVVMALECASEETEGPAAAALAERYARAIDCGLRGLPVSELPYSEIVIEDGGCSTLLLRDGLELQRRGTDGLVAYILAEARALPPEWFPLIVSIGSGDSPERAALLCDRALARPKDRPAVEAPARRLEGELMAELDALCPWGSPGALAVCAELTEGECCAVRLSPWNTRRAPQR